MASEATIDPRDRAKLRLPFDLLDRLDLFTNGVRRRILNGAYLKASRRKRGPQAWRVNEEDILLSSCQVLRETLATLELELSKYGKRTLRVRDAS